MENHHSKADCNATNKGLDAYLIFSDLGWELICGQALNWSLSHKQQWNNQNEHYLHLYAFHLVDMNLCDEISIADFRALKIGVYLRYGRLFKGALVLGDTCLWELLFVFSWKENESEMFVTISWPMHNLSISLQNLSLDHVHVH